MENHTQRGLNEEPWCSLPLDWPEHIPPVDIPMVEVLAGPWEYSDMVLLVIFQSDLVRPPTSDVDRRMDGEAAIFVGQPKLAASSRILNPAATVLLFEALW